MRLNITINSYLMHQERCVNSVILDFHVESNSTFGGNHQVEGSKRIVKPA